METVSTSKDTNLAEKLMREIMNKDDKQLFAAMLYNCYSLIKPDVAMELAWRKDMFEFVMPFFIQNIKDLSAKVETVQKSTEEIKVKDKKNEEEKAGQQIDSMAMNNFGGFGDPLGQPVMNALMPPPGMMPPNNPMASALPGMGGGMQMPAPGLNPSLSSMNTNASMPGQGGNINLNLG
jgi:clathrin heavy chain